VLAHLADLALARGDLRQAESLGREALEIRRQALGEEHADFGGSLMTLGAIRQAAGAGQEAEDLLRRALAILTKTLPAGHWRVAEAESWLGGCLAQRRKAALAEPLLVGGYQGLLRGRGAGNARTAAALARLVAFYQGQGQAQAAAAWRSQASREIARP
jgi:eukaryotic-like serine/threonine-protein kinase